MEPLFILHLFFVCTGNVICFCCVYSTNSLSICLEMCCVNTNIVIFFRYQSWLMLYDTCVTLCSSVRISLFACLYWHGAVASLMTGFEVCKLFVASHMDTIWGGDNLWPTHLFSVPSRCLLCWRLPVWQTTPLIATWQTQKQARDRHAQKFGLKSRIILRLLVT